MGILHVFYIEPYKRLTDAGLYQALKEQMLARTENVVGEQQGKTLMKYVILIADDEAEIRDLLRLYLENSGYDVLEAADGLEALAVLEKEHVDLAVLDVMMPRMNGLHVLKRFGKRVIFRCLYFLQKMQIRIRFLGSIWARTII